MSSILTNNGAMTALQVLGQTNKGLSEVQSRISTGMKVADAKDNAAVWAVASVMRSDVSGFSTLKDNLALAESSVSVARGAAESITGLLGEMKDKILGAQDGTVDRTKLQADINELREQIKGIGEASQFNGVNYLKGEGTVSVLASLDRSTTGVSTSSITFEKQNLVVGSAAPSVEKVVAEGQVARTAQASVMDLDFTLDPDETQNGTLDLNVGGAAATQIDFAVSADSTLLTVAADMQASLETDFGTGRMTVSVTAENKIRITDLDGRGITGVTYSGGDVSSLDATTLVTEGKTAQIAVESESTYTIEAYKTGGDTYAPGDFTNVKLTQADGTATDVDVSAAADMNAVATALTGGGRTATWDAANGKLNIKDAQGRGIDLEFTGEKAGKLAALDTIDVTTTNGANAALEDIETMIQSSIHSASSLGSAQKRLSIQKEFMGKLGDALKSGIGTLVDADMTNESARLQALQVQQQLGTQAPMSSS